MKSPFAPLEGLLQAAQQVGPTVWGPVTKVEVTFSTGVSIPFDVGRIMPIAAPEQTHRFEPSSMQRKILSVLADGAKNAKQLKLLVGNNHLYDAEGGVDDLVAIGWVSKSLGKYALTPAGEDVAKKIGDDDDT